MTKDEPIPSPAIAASGNEFSEMERLEPHASKTYAVPKVEFISLFDLSRFSFYFKFNFPLVIDLATKYPSAYISMFRR